MAEQANKPHRKKKDKKTSTSGTLDALYPHRRTFLTYAQAQIRKHSLSRILEEGRDKPRDQAMYADYNIV